MKSFRQSYYDLFSRVYDRFVALHSTDKQGDLRHELAERTSVGSEERVLDTCTGTGSLLSHLKQKAGRKGLVVGLDFSLGMLQAADKKYRGMDRICLVQADCSRLPFKDRCFAAVTCSHAFYELKGATQKMTLDEIKRCLIAGRPFLMMEHEVPGKPLVRGLFYLRLLMMGRKQALMILNYEKRFLKRHFGRVSKVVTKGGRSKIYRCR